MTRYQQQVVKRMAQLHTNAPVRVRARESASASTIIGIVLMAGVVAWMLIVLAFSLQPR